MSASPFRRLSFLLLVAALAFPNHASAAPLDLGNLFGKVGGFFSALWGPSGCEINPDGGCGATPSPESRGHGCEIMPDGRCASAPVQRGSDGPLLADVGCEIEPSGRCGT